jgi:hypothetical protein
MEGMDNDTKRIAARVKKLLNLANDAGATEGERDNALRMAQATLAKYNLDMADVDAVTREAQDPRGQHEMIDQADLWACKVCHAVAEMMFCKYFVYSRRVGAHKKKHAFVGRKSNVEAAMDMSAWLIRCIEKESGIRMREIGELYPWRRSFCLGAADKIRRRVDEIVKNSKQAPGKGIVLASLYQTEMEANALVLAGMKMGTVRRGRNARTDAYYDGQKYGEGVNLNRQVKGTARPVVNPALRIGRSS